MNSLPMDIGDTFVFSKTVSESDVYLFAGITGDLSANHVNEEYMAASPYNTRIAHGLLSLAYTSYTSTCAAQTSSMYCVSYGYDRVRFLGAVLIGDTVNVKYTICEKNEDKMTTTADIELKNQRGELCLVARHILKFFKK